MRDDNIGFLPVTDASARFVGVITDRDLAVRVVAEGQGPDVPIALVMTRDTVRCRPDDELSVAEQLMARKSKSRIVVTDEERHVLGVISITDVAHRDDGWRVARTMKGITRREVKEAAPASEWPPPVARDDER
jgi:CBS domain-containing protein